MGPIHTASPPLVSPAYLPTRGAVFVKARCAGSKPCNGCFAPEPFSCPAGQLLWLVLRRAPLNIEEVPASGHARADGPEAKNAERETLEGEGATTMITRS
eukprot:351651-Chlamydomonas_euryale.AAC.2